VTPSSNMIGCTSKNDEEEHNILNDKQTQHSNHASENDTSDMHMHHDSSRPIWVTVIVGVSHCGAGCVLGDLVGEWLVWGIGLRIGNPRHSI